MHFKFDLDYVHRTCHRVAMVVVNTVVDDSRVLKTAQTVSKLGFRVCLYGLHNKDAPTMIEGYPFEIVLLPSPYFEMMRSGKWSVDPADRDWNEVTNVFASYLQEQLKQKPADIVHTHDMVGLAVGGKLYQHMGKDAFSWIHDIHEYTYGATNIPDGTRAFLCSVEEKFIHCPDALTSVSPALSEILQNFYSLKTKPSLVLNAPRCSDFDSYYPKDVRSVLGVPQNVPLLVYSGGVKPIRGIETLVQVLPMLPEAHIAIVTNSSGSFVEELKRTARKMGVAKRIHFHPYVPFMNVTSFLRTATVGIHPMMRSPNAEIALPNKLFEYIHAGLPSVVSNNRSIEEFVNRHDCGLAFEVGNASALAEAVTRVLDRLHSEPSWCQSIRSLSQQYSWETQETVIANIYDSLAPRKSCNNDSLVKGKNYRVLQLPTAAAGQPSTLARAMKEKGVSASVLGIASSYAKFQYKADIIVENVSNDLASYSHMMKDIIPKYDVFHFHFRPLLFSKHYFSPTGMDLILLRTAGKKVFFHFRGSEARLAPVFAKCSPYNYVSENPDRIFDNYKADEQRIFIEFVSGVCHNVFVSDAELQTYVPEALIVPRVVDLKEWACAEAEASGVLRVVHAPSWPVAKGTKEVLSAVGKLRSEGIPIELRLVENTPHDEAKKLYGWADVVIDQLRTGWYGVLAVEAMALGKAVISYVRDDLKHYLPYPLPLAVANPDNLYQVLKDLASNPAEVRSLGQRGRQYVEELHDSEKVTDIVLQLYEAEGNSFDVDKAIGLLAFQETHRISKPGYLVLKYGIFTRSIGYLNKQNIVLFFRILRREGMRAAVRKAYNVIFH